MFSVQSQDSFDSAFEPFQSAQRPHQPAAEESDITSAEGEEQIDHPENDEGDLKLTTQQQDSSNDESREYAYHPNRFKETPSTWKRWTAPERELAASLDQLTSQDLSLHLYNAFKLNQRSVTHQSLAKGQDHRQDGRDLFATTWVPPRTWTAWPLPSKVVPREDRSTLLGPVHGLPYPYLPKPAKASETLMEILVAQALRRAKLRLQDRDWETPTVLGAETTQAVEELVTDKNPPVDHSPTNNHIPSASENSSPSAESEQSHDTPLNFSHTAEEPSENAASSDFRPVVMEDDEAAMSILQPSIMHVLTRLDELLSGLHRIRSSYLSVDAPEFEYRSQAEDHLLSTSQSRKRGRNPSTQRPPRSMSVDATGSDSEEPRFKSPKKRRSMSSGGDRFRRRKEKLGLRNWSDILGVASITGFDPDVVEHAASRCADLHDEEIALPTLNHGVDSFRRQTFCQTQANPQAQRRSTDESQDWLSSRGGLTTQERMLGGIHQDGFLQPIEGKRSWKASRPKQKRDIE